MAAEKKYENKYTQKLSHMSKNDQIPHISLLSYCSYVMKTTYQIII